MKFKAVLFLLITISFNTRAETSDTQVWTTLIMQGLLANDTKFGGYLEFQPRYSDKQERSFEHLLRPAVFYRTESKGTFHLGYLSRSNSERKEIEKRYWAQWSRSYTYEKLNAVARFRYEVRDLNLPKNSERLRAMGRLVHSDFIFANAKPFASMELFYNLNDVRPSIRSGLQQSRTAIGLTHKFESSFTLEYAYMKNLIDSATTEDQNNNVLQLTFIKDF